MVSRKRASAGRTRVGKVSVYEHHGAWWLYFREHGRPVRRKVADDRRQAEQVAAEVNAKLVANAPTLLSFCPAPVADLRRRFLDYHESVLQSSVATVRR